MSYDDTTCFWCGTPIAKEQSIFSLATDGIKVQRNFCCNDHLVLFKKFAESKAYNNDLPVSIVMHAHDLPSYQGKE